VGRSIEGPVFRDGPLELMAEVGELALKLLDRSADLADAGRQ
jgi:hypothetical protein